MSTSRTSQAVEELVLLWSVADPEIISRHTLKNCKGMRAIAEKFRHMEEALALIEAIASDTKQVFKQKAVRIAKIARAAQSFDPLSND